MTFALVSVGRHTGDRDLAIIEDGRAAPLPHDPSIGSPAIHDPGGRALPLPSGVIATAIYGGPGGCYRYRLDWLWAAGRPRLVAGLMNPSMAGQNYGDSTVAWVHRWAAARGFGALTVVNASAYRCTDQTRLAETADPMGPDNARHILAAAQAADLVVLGFGMPKVKAARGHGPALARLLQDAGIATYAWAVNADGTPRHPLYLPAVTEVMPWPQHPAAPHFNARRLANA